MQREGNARVFFRVLGVMLEYLGLEVGEVVVLVGEAEGAREGEVVTLVGVAEGFFEGVAVVLVGADDGLEVVGEDVEVVGAVEGEMVVNVGPKVGDDVNITLNVKICVLSC